MCSQVLAAARRVVEHELEKYAHNRADKMLNFCVDLYQMNSTNLIETILKQGKNPPYWARLGSKGPRQRGVNSVFPIWLFDRFHQR